MRPQAISLICLLGIIGAAGSIFITFWANSLPWDYRIWMLLMAGVQVKAVQGIWNMKKWGVVLYAGRLVFVQIGMMVAGIWSFFNLMFPVLIMLVLSKYYNDMT